MVFLVLTLILVSAQGRAFAATDLPPLFRLPAGGRPLAPPVLDTSRDPAALWFLSEDRSLYLLSETGILLAKREQPGARPFLALDAFGRALLIIDTAPDAAPGAAGSGGPVLVALTRSGNRAWAADLRWLLGSGASASSGLAAPAFGPDGRLLLAAGRRLLCLAASGTPLWTRELPAQLALAPSMDGNGDFLLGLEGGRLVILSPYGGEKSARSLGRPIVSLGAFASPGAGGLGAAAFSGAVGLDDGSLVLLPTSGGGRVATTMVTVPPAAPARPVVALTSDGATLVALDAGGIVTAIDGAGTRVWSTATGITDGRLALSPGRVLVTGKGRAASLSRGGEVFREATITNAVAIGLLAPSGLLFSAGADWILAAYRFEAALGSLPAPALARCPADERAVEALRNYDPRVAEEGRQLELVADIEKRLDLATIGEYEAGDRAVLAAIALGGFSSGFPAAERRFRVPVLPGVLACALLGRIGSPAAIDDLAAVASAKADVSVRAAAFDALGAIGVDPAGSSGRAFAVAAGGSPLDDQVALALVGAIESMARRSGATPTVEAARALVRLAGAPYGNAVRDRAMAALGRIARGD
jgi:hypothetical protein